MGLVLKFQSTRPRGARRQAMVKIPAFYVFQSTRPRGARPHHAAAFIPNE